MSRGADTFNRQSNERIADLEREQKFRMFFAGLIFAIISFIGAHPISNAPLLVKFMEVIGLFLLFLSGIVVLLEISEDTLKRNKWDLMINNKLHFLAKYHWMCFLIGMMFLLLNRSILLFY